MIAADPRRARLAALRDDALRQLAEGDAIDSGLLRLFADASAALAVLNAAVDAAPQAGRVVVSDDGETLRLVCYRGPEALAVVSLDPVHAVRSGAALAAVAARHLTRGGL